MHFSLSPIKERVTDFSLCRINRTFVNQLSSVTLMLYCVGWLLASLCGLYTTSSLESSELFFLSYYSDMPYIGLRTECVGVAYVKK